MYAGLGMAAFVSGYKKCPDSRRRPDERVPDVKAFLEAVANGEFFEGLCVEDVEPGKCDGHLGNSDSLSEQSDSLHSEADEEG
eukprot:2011020-Rhodomonas_salina.1